MENVLAILLAGGAGERLYPLTRDTAKPAVPFGGVYRIIDFTLSNCINSDVRRIFILTQYKALELIRHVRDGWNILSPELGEYIEIIPPMKRVSDDWYQGTADAVFQNFQSIEAEAPSATLILSGDHIYKMNYHEMIDWHRRHNADVTLATIQVPPEEACRFGVAEIHETTASSASRRSPSTATPSAPASTRHGQRLHGHLRVQDRRPPSRAPRRRPGPQLHPRFRPGRHPALLGPLPRDRLRLPRHQRQTGPLLARRRHPRRLLRGQHGPGRVVPEFNLYDRSWPIRTKSPSSRRPSLSSPRKAAAWG